MKKTVLHTAILALTLPMSLHAIGLGNMTVKSALDQPFSAEIELIDVGSTPLPGIKVGIADPENFDEIGIERTAVLSLLNFRIEKNKQGKYIIVVQSTERMTEPYIEMVVDVTWPQGQLYRAYTVLLDPPGYQLISTTAQSSSTHYKTVQKHTYEPGVINKTVTTEVEHNPISLNDSKKKATYGPTITNENVWQIALRYKASEVILPQVVLAIVGANPDAFKEGNLNGLKIGVRLVIPGTEDIMRVPADLATEEVMAHDKAWNEKAPINHVLSPPYMNGKTLTSGSPANNSQIPVIPKMTMQAEPVPSSSTQLISINAALPGMNTNQQQSAPDTNNTTQNIDRDATTRAELSITTAAVESVRESNALLMEQLHLLQDQNKKLQQQLDKRDKELERLQAQVQMMMKQRFAVAAQASSANAGNSNTSYWPFILLLIVAAGVGGFAYWYFIHRKQDGKDSPYLTDTPIQPKPIIPSVEPVSILTEDSVTETQIQPQPQLQPEVASVEASEANTPVDVINHENDNILTDTQNDSIAEHNVTEVEKEEDPEIAMSTEKTVKKRPGRKKKETVSETLLELAAKNELYKEEPKGIIEIDELVKASVNEASVTPEQPKAEESAGTLIEVPPVQQDNQPVEPEQDKVSEPVNDAELANNEVLEFESGLHELLQEQSKQQPAKNTVVEDNGQDMSLDFVSSLSETPETVQIDNPVVDDTGEGEYISDSHGSQENMFQPEEAASDDLASATQMPEVDLDKSITDFFVEPTQEQMNSDDRYFADDASIKSEPETNKESVNPLKSTKALNTLLDLAKTYIGMDDFESARHSLEEVLEFGNEQQKTDAKALLEQIKDK
ncbi:pilus assembly protein FimV [Legionella sp. km535]|uniref:FimV/HubP family polar landmark protein n=1 Tax=Legionella sp. km535 TaxID=2498107 RepID=UPI000F8E62C5|nr:FimV/HubP family polar landmark protein [Legionella sp. km535]RUR15674.1 pilus assembly protein FimV [Legionella sp. km535]